MLLAKSLLLVCLSPFVISSPLAQSNPFAAAPRTVAAAGPHDVSDELFAELEELARLVDIAYCVGMTGIYRPFRCASHCADFKGFQLVDTWNTGPLFSDSCGYIVLDHPGQRIIVAFRGTYSITNTIVDLGTIPQEYVPLPDDLGGGSGLWPHRPSFRLPNPRKWWEKIKHHFWKKKSELEDIRPETSTAWGRPYAQKCTNCTVHMGFLSSWKNTRSIILSHLSDLRKSNPSYTLHLVGHSLGGAIAALAGLETSALGYDPIVTTFGEPRIGNLGLREYLDTVFGLDGDENGTWGNQSDRKRYRRITHITDPVPLLPSTKWGYRSHAGEIFISKAPIRPKVTDLRHCDGDEDVRCIYGAGDPPEPVSEEKLISQEFAQWDSELITNSDREISSQLNRRQRALPIMWGLVFAHRDYIWRLGLCVPGGDPTNWKVKHEDIFPDGSRGLTVADTDDDDVEL